MKNKQNIQNTQTANYCINYITINKFGGSDGERRLPRKHGTVKPIAEVEKCSVTLFDGKSSKKFRVSMPEAKNMLNSLRRDRNYIEER